MRANVVLGLVLAALLFSLPVAAEGDGEVLPAGVSPGWLSEAKANLETMEYHFTRQKDGFHAAPNRAHGLRTRVTEEGIEVESRVWGASEGEGWHLTLRPARFGRGTAFETVLPGLARFEEGRATLLREAFTELYVNDARGLEQIFDVPAPPRGSRDAGPLRIEMTLGGNVLANLSEDGALVVFGGPAGKPVAHLRDLLVLDSTGAAVPARFRLAPGSLAIEVDDLDAVYPLHVDPLLTTAVWSEDSDQTGAAYGYSVATAGDVNGDGFSDVLIGILLYDGGSTDEGRVSLYKGQSSGLPTTPSKNFEQNQAFANFGWSVSTGGDVNGDGFDDILVGAPNWDGGMSNCGGVFLYLGSNAIGGPDDVADEIREGFQTNEHLGVSVAWAGDTDGDGYDDIVAGAPDYDDFEFPNFIFDVGRASLFFGDPVDVLRSLGKSFGQDQEGARFGWTVRTAGDVNGDGFDDVIIGAPDWDTASNVDGGKAYAYYGSSTGPSATPSWEVEFNETSAHFAFSVSTAGDTNGDGYADVVIGAYLDDNGAGSLDEGAIHVYRGSSTGLNLGATHTRRSGEVGGQLGFSVGTAGDVNGDGYADIVAGAPFVDAGGTDRGRAYVWCGSSTGIPLLACWQVDGTNDSGQYGHAVATAGDVNGDGYSDVVVGGWKIDNGSTDEGRAFVYLGSGDLLTPTFAKKLEVTGGLAENLGTSVAYAGDVNGDGFGDVIVGDPQWSGADDGAAFIFLGTATGPATAPSTTLENDDQFGDAYGLSVASAGDVNGDGYDDVVVGAPFWSVDPDGDEDENGRVYVYFGGSGGVNATADFEDTPSDLGLDSNAGLLASPAGDVNGDGFGDFIVGGRESHGFSFLYYGAADPDDFEVDFVDGAQPLGAGDVNRDGYSDVFTMFQNSIGGDEARVFLGSPTGLPNGAAWSRFEEVIGGCPVGDVNGDGFDDLVLHESDFTVTTRRLFLGSTTGLPTTASQTLTYDIFNCRRAGDVNGDGREDILTREGFAESVKLYLGTSTGLATAVSQTLATDIANNDFGDSFGFAGDTNGDGFDDVLVGAPNGLSGGNAQLFYGGGGDGLERLPRQGHVATTAPVALLGNADGTQVKLKLMLRSPAGRGRVGFRYETALLGGTFGTGPSATVDPTLIAVPGTGGSKTDTSVSVTGLTAESTYKWRARLLTANPLFPRSKWLSMSGNGPGETDFQTPCASSTWYRDLDVDGFGNTAVTLTACTQPAGYVATPGDCNDSDNTMFPGNPEVCDGKDNNCAGGIDDGFVAPTGRTVETTKKTGSSMDLIWEGISGADRYDIVRGTITKLKSTLGDYKFSTFVCLANDLASKSVTDAAVPTVGDGFWYLVRPVNCTAPGSYDENTHSQIGDRDAEIAASGVACP